MFTIMEGKVMETREIRKYLKSIESFYLRHRRMPSYSDMLKIFSLRSKNAVFKRVAILVEKGFLDKDGNGRLIARAASRPVPVLGVIKAGFPSPAEEELGDLMSLDEYLIGSPQATFILKVDGDSMLDAGIHPGDLVLVQKDLTPRSGDIVIAYVDNEWTLKYFEKKDGRIFLRAANEEYPPIIPKRELVIMGVVVANVRKYK